MPCVFLRIKYKEKYFAKQFDKQVIMGNRKACGLKNNQTPVKGCLIMV